VNGTASKPGGGTWAVFSDERLKNIKGTYSRPLMLPSSRISSRTLPAWSCSSSWL
jgi:hypothetical protein